MPYSQPLPDKNSLWREVLLEYAQHDIVENEKIKCTVAEREGKKRGILEELEAHKNEKGLPRNQLAYNIGFYELPYLRKNGLIEYTGKGYGKITEKGRNRIDSNQ